MSDLAEAIIRDLETGALDLAQASKKIRDLDKKARKEGAIEYAALITDRTAQLAAENRRLRERLVSQSLQIKQQERGANG